MNSTCTRRTFLRSSAATLAGLAALPAGAIEPFARAGAPRLQLSLAAYSFRDFLKDGGARAKAAPDAAHNIDLFQFIDYCAEHGCAGTELTSYYFAKNFDDAYLIKLRRHAFLRGIDISGTAVGNSFTEPAGDKRDAQIATVKKWVDHAAVLGAPHIRVFAGNASQGLTRDDAKKNCIAALDECGDYAGKRGIFLGLENHGGIVAEAPDILDIIRAVKTPWVGINLDTGNFQTDDPYHDLELIAPYAVNVQMKGEVHPRGQKKQEADLARLVKILRDAKYQGYVALEYEGTEDPWKAVPVLLKKMKDLFA
jgi:sugar phosphate isomerase/epimerase